ncbi:MAG: hypothetical protein U1A06_20790, partial [Hoeflea sp.]|nr:hypothetical protein [Hoeflea sp.]
ISEVYFWPEFYADLINLKVGPFLVGRDAEDIEGIHGDLQVLLISLGYTGHALAAISGVDIALHNLDGGGRGVVDGRELEIGIFAEAGAAGQRVIGRGAARARAEIMLAAVGRSGDPFPASLPADQHKGQQRNSKQRDKNQQDGLEQYHTPG